MEQETQGIDSLFDYFYLDGDRINHWLAQLDQDGVLNSLSSKSSKTEGSASNAGFKAGLEGGLASTESFQDAIERTYSSEWSRPLMLLDLLSREGMIHKDINSCPIGSLVQTSGSVQLFDISFIQSGIDVFKRMALADKGINSGKPKGSQKRTHQSEIDHLDMIGEMIKILPNNPQIYIKDSNKQVIWSALEQRHMRVNPTSLSLSNGAFLSGEWHAIGILDGHKDDDLFPPPTPFATSDLSNSICHMLQALKTGIGRGAGTFSMTPLVIFRAIQPMGEK